MKHGQSSFLQASLRGWSVFLHLLVRLPVCYMSAAGILEKHPREPAVSSRVFGM